MELPPENVRDLISIGKAAYPMEIVFAGFVSVAVFGI